MPLSQQQVAGHLGVANNPQLSSAVQHSSRQTIMSSAAGSGRSHSSIAGQIGVTTNPQCSVSTQHSARQAIMKAASQK